MQAECVRRYLDTYEGKVREVGERFECDVIRFAEINSTKYGTLVVEVHEPSRPKRRTRRTTKE